MKKVVIRLSIHSDREKQKALKAVSSIQGLDSLSIDMEAKTMTIIGNVDPVEVICKLRRSCCSEIITVGPKEEPKKDDGSAEAKKKEEEEKKKKEEEDKKKKEEEEKKKKEGEQKKEDDVKCDCGHHPFACRGYLPQSQCYPPMNYVVHCVDECPPSCVIM